MRLKRMRYLYALSLAYLMILAAGCSASQPAATIELVPTPTPDVAISMPMNAGLDPVQTGLQLLASADWRQLESPAAVDVRQMTYVEARQLIPMLSEEGEQFWGRETPLWLVVYRGRWGSSDPAQINAQPYEGCLFVLFRAADGKMIATGTTACPGQ